MLSALRGATAVVAILLVSAPAAEAAEAAAVDARGCARVRSGGRVVPHQGQGRRGGQGQADGHAALEHAHGHVARCQGEALVLAEDHDPAHDPGGHVHAAGLRAARLRRRRAASPSACASPRSRRRPLRHAAARRRPAHAAARPRSGTHAGGAAQPARAADRRELLLRHGRSLQERQPGQRQGRASRATIPDVHGYDPTKKGFFHGGDLQGLLEKIDYIEGLGTTAIWLTPSFKNRAVQGPPGQRSAGYHGYWVTDFTQIDPHFGTNAELKRSIDAAHARGIKVFFDIITNHTADVIAYTENRYTYVSKDTEPFRTARGTPFDDRDYAGTNTFPALDAQASFPLTPYVPAGIESKTPAWLNDLTLYHNRGDTTFVGEDSPVRRLLRPRRPLHRAPARRRRDDRDLRDVDPGHAHRRLPDRHDEARQRRVLAEVLAGRPAVREGRRQGRTSSCSARSPTARGR